MKSVKSFGPNLIGRDFVCGDIHGRFDLLSIELERVGFHAGFDRLFCVGDLVDRGAHSHEVTSWVNKSWFHSVRGNHEQCIVEAAAGCIDREWHIEHGAGWFYGIGAPHQQIIADAFSRLPIAIEVATMRGNVGIVHAEVFGGWRRFCDSLPDNIGPLALKGYFQRRRWKEKDTSRVIGIDAVVVGHVIVPEEPRWVTRCISKPEHTKRTSSR